MKISSAMKSERSALIDDVVDQCARQALAVVVPRALHNLKLQYARGYLAEAETSVDPEPKTLMRLRRYIDSLQAYSNGEVTLMAVEKAERYFSNSVTRKVIIPAHEILTEALFTHAGALLIKGGNEDAVEACLTQAFYTCFEQAFDLFAKRYNSNGSFKRIVPGSKLLHLTPGLEYRQIH